MKELQEPLVIRINYNQILSFSSGFGGIRKPRQGRLVTRAREAEFQALAVSSRTTHKDVGSRVRFFPPLKLLRRVINLPSCLRWLTRYNLKFSDFYWLSSSSASKQGRECFVEATGTVRNFFPSSSPARITFYDDHFHLGKVGLVKASLSSRGWKGLISPKTKPLNCTGLYRQEGVEGFLRNARRETPTRNSVISNSRHKL